MTGFITPPLPEIPEPLKSSIEKLVDQKMESFVSSGRVLATPVPRTAPKRKTVQSTTKGFEFEKLPTELRLKIWEELVSEPRIVEVYISQGYFKGKNAITFASNTPVPVCLHINQESRHFALKQYELSFACKWDGTYGGKSTIYFNFSQDVAYFKVTNMFSTDRQDSKSQLDLGVLYFLDCSTKHKPLTCKRLKKVPIPINAAADHSLGHSLRFLPKLKEVILVGSEVEARELREDDDEETHYNNRRKCHRNLNIMEPEESSPLAGLPTRMN